VSIPAPAERFPGFTRTRPLRRLGALESLAPRDTASVRLGLLLPRGGADFLQRIRAVAQPELGWDDARWEAEERAYLETWARRYAMPA
jgi:glycerol-3-phosphate dehydrogenase